MKKRLAIWLMSWAFGATVECAVFEAPRLVSEDHPPVETAPLRAPEPGPGPQNEGEGEWEPMTFDGTEELC